VEGILNESGLLPELGGQIAIGCRDGGKSRFGKVTQGASVPVRRLVKGSRYEVRQAKLSVQDLGNTFAKNREFYNPWGVRQHTENTSLIPAMVSIFFGTVAATIPVPRGAGIRRTETEPHLPVTLQGTV
jgi:hypothetical protein